MFAYEISVQNMLLRDPAVERCAVMSAAYIPHFGKRQIQYKIINLYHRCIVAAATFSSRNAALPFEMVFECHNCFL